MRLTTDAELEQSTVVANTLMNRERRLPGYNRELGLDIPAVLRRTATNGPARWLDLCCGAAYALGEATHLLGRDAEIVGMDLVDFFACRPDPRASASSRPPPPPGTRTSPSTSSPASTASTTSATNSPS
ncbi:hypothetical protein ACFQQB_13565 [Nonomuraea rubra]|uniref:hypothetical protein n=1 Tax=Nonomuraea rubra TaxID=46180 RepID=UPI00361E2B9A